MLHVEKFAPYSLTHRHNMSGLNDFRCIRISHISWFLTSQSRLHNECSDHDNDVSASRDSQSKQRAAKEMGTTGHVQDTIY